MYPINEVLTDLRAAGFAAKELARLSEEELSNLYDALIMDKSFWERRLQTPDREYPAYPNLEISLAQTLAGMSTDEKTALRKRIRKA